MIIFAAFVLIFLFSLATYMASKSFKLAITLPVIAYLFAIGYYFLTSQNHQALHREVQLLLFFGTPMVFFASLLGPYIVEKYRGSPTDKVTDMTTTKEDQHE